MSTPVDTIKMAINVTPVCFFPRIAEDTSLTFQVRNTLRSSRYRNPNKDTVNGIFHRGLCIKNNGLSLLGD